MNSTPGQLDRASVLDAVLCIAIAGALLFAFSEPLSAMVKLWDASPMYSYGYAVPPVSAYLLWVSRARLADANRKPARLAGAIVLIGAIARATARQAAGIQMLGP